MQESQINLAIQAIASSKKLSVRRAAKIYNIPHTTLTYRMAGRTPKAGSRSIHCKMTELEEKSLFQYIIDMDERGFSPRISDVEDMANYILETRGAKKVGKLWAHRFVKRHTKLKTRFNRVYDFQRALCEDSELIERWFRLVSNMRAKYGILDCDLYNFDETGFMMGQISPHIVVTKADRYGKSKAIQPGNREWATAIICVDGEGHNIPPFLIVKGEHHLSNWYTEGDLPYDWLIKPTTNGWTDNETGLEWIKHFNKHTESRKVGRYRMLVLDGHESHKSPAFQEYCKEHNIILLSLPPHSSHLTQPLDIGCFGSLKRSYSRQIENFIKAHITHITKTEFFQAFKAAYIEAISISNGKAGFRGAGLIPFNPEIVLSKLDIRIRTPSDRLISADLDIWQSQTPHNPTEALSQSTLVKSRIARHQGSSPTPIFETVAALAKGIELLAHANTLLTAEVHSLRKANEALSKLRRARKALIRKGGALSVEDGHSISEQENVEDQIRRDEYTNDGSSARRQATIRRCSKCGSTLHNARTCQFDPALVDL
ncbi:hypothetical protein SS1G_09530 [Sclerotinia sclerotiorum 1980 UF-70]|uniref:HTH CENPB-type domain-containing protein n=2 Tax=Sclerotinia sclerotiorum (strain ATCC 18683 / 1980 / Ss-1) TaxID=665079 RepID=A7EW21_SCLS1|nr:hypothetical protein SS1G_09530 [Sclerotinia sclerotiorum 1980 UF-70]APA15656.1 hypothetical protein sscle_15g104260 [Sclerotinia sclerotiorum 1980 UF-70]EDN93663.1 hypothetical protein SS1G_09530 [Sclerotinia sclerotiorum 1980 UF-70]